MDTGAESSAIVDEVCRETDGTEEFVEQVNGAEVAQKLLRQIEQLGAG
jgi:hypothetical protein